jgi:hypothetical protein
MPAVTAKATNDDLTVLYYCAVTAKAVEEELAIAPHSNCNGTARGTIYSTEQ